jgi:hypothetical protein
MFVRLDQGRRIHRKRESLRHVSSRKVYVADCVRDCVRLGAPETTEIASTFEIGRYADNSTQRLPRCSARSSLDRISRTESSPTTITSPLKGGAALTGKSGRKSANAGDTSARQTSMHTAAHFMFAKIESRQSRVERKALVFFPTLNKRLSMRTTEMAGRSSPTVRNCLDLTLAILEPRNSKFDSR